MTDFINGRFRVGGLVLPPSAGRSGGHNFADRERSDIGIVIEALNTLFKGNNAADAEIRFAHFDNRDGVRTLSAQFHGSKDDLPKEAIDVLGNDNVSIVNTNNSQLRVSVGAETKEKLLESQGLKEGGKVPA